MRVAASIGFVVCALLAMVGCTGNRPEAQPATPTNAAPRPAPRPATTLKLAAPAEAPRERHPVELALTTDGVWANPFDPDQVDLTVTITGPGAATLTVPAFWYSAYEGSLRPTGEPGWRVRFTPTRPGQWTAQARLAALTSAPLRLSVAADPAAPGFLRTNKDGFRYDSGAPFLPIGPNIGWSRSAPEKVISDYERWFAALSANGGNAARIWLAPWGFSPEWTDTGLGDYSGRLRQLWQLDRVFDLADRYGIRIMLTLLNHGQFSETTNAEWAQNPFNRANGGPLATPRDFVTDPTARKLFERRLRYLAARYAAEPSLWAWEWWNEVNLTPIDDGVLAPWIQAMTPVLRRFDPYRHPITTSYASGGSSDIWALPELDFATEHVYHAADPVLRLPDLARAARERSRGKPVVLAEFGAGGSADDARFDPEGIHLHNGLWAGLFAGYHGPGMYWWWDEYIDPNNLWSQFKGVAAYLRGESLAGLSSIRPASTGDTTALALIGGGRALVWVRAAGYSQDVAKGQYSDAVADAMRDKTPLAYTYRPPAVRGATVTLTGLPPGAYQATWSSTSDGSTLRRDPVTVAADGSATLPVPDFVRDIAVRLAQP